MAVPLRNIRKAISLFQEIADTSNTLIHDRTEANQYDEDKILGIDAKEDGGWESIFINIRNISLVQLVQWNTQKESNGSSFSCHEVQPGITRLGFY